MTSGLESKVLWGGGRDLGSRHYNGLILGNVVPAGVYGVVREELLTNSTNTDW